MKVLITGGAGFVGSRLAHLFKQLPHSPQVTVLDNLRRRGSELNLRGFKSAGIQFQHGDIRAPSDLEDLDGNFDLFIDASAEPSVLAGLNGSPRYVLGANLEGTLHCLEFARRRCSALVFLSTSRVYSIEPLKQIELAKTATRFTPAAGQSMPGLTAAGISEDFSTATARSLYGATKLASELIVQEYAHAYGLNAVINRCGVIAGPGQFGKVDQGVFTLWVANHFFGKPLRYTGFGGTGLQVRDLLHPDDLFDLLQLQVAQAARLRGGVFNVGGGEAISVSLREMTALCRESTGREVPVAEDPTTSAVDIPWYATDHGRATQEFGWRPTRNSSTIVQGITDWIRTNESEVKPLFA